MWIVFFSQSNEKQNDHNRVIGSSSGFFTRMLKNFLDFEIFNESNEIEIFKRTYISLTL